MRDAGFFFAINLSSESMSVGNTRFGARLHPFPREAASTREYLRPASSSSCESHPIKNHHDTKIAAWQQAREQVGATHLARVA
jgi:hypothetical protein